MPRTFTQSEVEILIQQGIKFGEENARKAYRNIQLITRVACFRWASGGFLAGAAFVIIWVKVIN